MFQLKAVSGAVFVLAGVVWGVAGARAQGTEERPATGLRLDLEHPEAARLRFEGRTDRDHRVEVSSDLVNWAPGSLVSANAVGPTSFEAWVPGSGGGAEGAVQARRFFRVVSSPERAAAPVPPRVARQIPHYGEGEGSDELRFTYAYPESLLAPAGDPAFGAGASAAGRLDEAQLALARTEGLAAWRRVGNHGSCVGCHTPDGYDLALIGYSDADITRRALDHVDEADAARIVTWVKALRQMHGIQRPLHPLRFRPLQPGMEVLPGNTAAARDQAFATYLRDELGLRWASERIESRAQAKAAEAELLALDLRKLRVGIPFDLWSEDHTRGAAHRSASEWLPMMAMRPKAGRAAQWHGLHDAYLVAPTDANFQAYYTRIGEMLEPVEPAGFARGQEWSELKYRSVQIVQHMLRNQSLAMPDPVGGAPGGMVANRATLLAGNPIFRTGDHVRRFPLQFDTANASTLFPAHLAPTLPSLQNELREQNENFFRVWFWMGWAQDPALLLSDHIFQTVEGDYLYASLLQQHDIHHAFVVARTSVAKAAAQGFFNVPGEGVAGHGKWASFTPFMVLHHIERNRSEPPAGDPRRAAHDLMFSNTARLWIYLVHDDLEATGSVFDRELVRGSIRFARAWLDSTEAGLDHAALDSVIADIETRLTSATELRTNFNTPDLPGGLPFN
jgi:hypothetical protein